MKPIAKNFLLLALMVAASGLAVAVRPTHRIANQAERLSLEAIIPAQFDGWQIDKTIVPVEPAPELRAVIAATYSQTLSRTYVHPSGAHVMLSLAYGENQDEDKSTHRPEVCYPAQGFDLISSRAETLNLFGRTVPLHRVIAKQGARNEPISYWVVVGDQITEFGIKHKLTTLKYGITGRIPDGMLIRVSSIDRDEKHAFQQQDKFIHSLLSAMSEKDQIRLLGALPN